MTIINILLNRIIMLLNIMVYPSLAPVQALYTTLICLHYLCLCLHYCVLCYLLTLLVFTLVVYIVYGLEKDRVFLYDHDSSTHVLSFDQLRKVSQHVIPPAKMCNWFSS